MLMKKVLRMTLVLIMALVANVAMAQKVVTFTAGTDKGTQGTVSVADSVAKDGISISCDKGAFAAKEYRLGQGSKTTFSTTTGTITQIVFNCTANADAKKYGPNCIEVANGNGKYAYKGMTGTWTGAATKVEFSASKAQLRAKSIEVTIALGGDNCIAVAMILAVLADDDLPHPPIEAVFTVDEEVGMDGAAALDCSDLKGRRLLNLDSEQEGVFTVSCAGGMRMDCVLPAEQTAVSGGDCFALTISGLQGGHCPPGSCPWCSRRSWRRPCRYGPAG